MAGDPTAPPFADGFEVVRRGYDQQQVDGHLQRLDAEVRILVADRDAAVDQAAQLGRELDKARAHAERLRAQVRTLVQAPQSVQGMSERMRSMLRLAEDEVAEMLAQAAAEVTRRREEAQRQAAEILAAARAEADTMRSATRDEAERLAAEDARRRAELDHERESARETLAAEQARIRREQAAAAEQAERERAREWAASEARRAAVEEDFTIAMDQRRAEALAELQAGRVEAYRRNAEMIAAATEQAHRTVADAEEHARRVVAEADARVAELTALRGQVAEQLGTTQRLLDGALGALAPAPPAPAVTSAVQPVEPAPADGGPAGAAPPQPRTAPDESGTTAVEEAPKRPSPNRRPRRARAGATRG